MSSGRIPSPPRRRPCTASYTHDPRGWRTCTPLTSAGDRRASSATSTGDGAPCSPMSTASYTCSIVSIGNGPDLRKRNCGQAGHLWMHRAVLVGPDAHRVGMESTFDAEASMPLGALEKLLDQVLPGLARA